MVVATADMIAAVDVGMIVAALEAEQLSQAKQTEQAPLATIIVTAGLVRAFGRSARRLRPAYVVIRHFGMGTVQTPLRLRKVWFGRRS